MGYGIFGVNFGSFVIEVMLNFDCYFVIYIGEVFWEIIRKVLNMVVKYGLFCFFFVLLVSLLFVFFGL